MFFVSLLTSGDQTLLSVIPSSKLCSQGLVHLDFHIAIYEILIVLLFCFTETLLSQI